MAPSFSMGRRVAIIQSSYLPWKGYFDIIRSVDHFVLFDDAQFTRRDWRNRNRIKTPQGLAWLTVPVKSKGLFTAPIRAIEVEGREWAVAHWTTIRRNYAKAPQFAREAPALEELFLTCGDHRLSQINRHFIDGLCRIFGISTPVSWSWEYDLAPGRSERLLSVCQQLGADTYLSGPSAASYLDEDLFRRAGIRIQYADYSNYPEYPQLYPPYESHVSIVDLLLNVGRATAAYMKTF
jgi:hypothetical protein